MPALPTIVVYPGYANETTAVVFGHVFRQNLRHWYPYSDNFFKNLRVLWKLFRVKALSDVVVELTIDGQQARTITDATGFYRFEVSLRRPLSPGWTAADVRLFTVTPGEDLAFAQGKVLTPVLNSYDIISDIDDTLLISHSLNWWKKLRLLVMHEPHKRQPFEQVASHYEQLYASNSRRGGCLFAYVSSSEWNLYAFIRAFLEAHHLPRGVYLLQTLKMRLLDLLRTGGGDHNHKLNKIRGLLLFYPAHRFILLGDDTQRDPKLYMEVVRSFPKQIAGVYIRHTRMYPSKEVEAMMGEIWKLGVPFCYFSHSEEAIRHSVEMGFIDAGV